MKTFILSVILLVLSCTTFLKAQQNSYLVRDIKLGKLGSNPTTLVAMRGLLYFVAEDGINGTQLWKSDGTEAGTTIVRILPSHGIFHLTSVQGKIYFFLYYNSKAFLWKSDGTEAGTQVVREFESSILNNVQYRRDVNGLFVFTVMYGAAPGLWRSDGSAQGTYLLKGFSETEQRGGFVHLDGTLYFSISANYGQAPAELWKTNGTVEGTQLVRVGLPGLGQMTDVNNTLYFVSGTALWKSNGTNAGTTLVAELQNPVANITVNGNGEIFFTMFNQKSSGYELWKSDGTQSGTFKLTNIPNPNIYNLQLPFFKAIRNRVYFHGNFNGEQELFTSDGTEAGTGLVRDIYFNYSSNPTSLLEIEGQLYFMTTHPTLYTSEIWRSDGTAQGTRRIDSNGCMSNNTGSGMVYENGLLYFISGYHYIENQLGHELWAIDIRKITDIKNLENTLTSNSLHIYPNPFENSATISVQGDILPDTEYILFDVLGREVRRFKNELPRFTFDRSSLNAGMYTLQLSNKSGMIHQRLVIIN